MGNINSSITSAFANQMQQQLADLQMQRSQLTAYNQQMRQSIQQIQQQAVSQYPQFRGAMGSSGSNGGGAGGSGQVLQGLREIVEEDQPKECKALRGLLDDLL